MFSRNFGLTCAAYRFERPYSHSDRDRLVRCGAGSGGPAAFPVRVDGGRVDRLRQGRLLRELVVLDRSCGPRVRDVHSHPVRFDLARPARSAPAQRLRRLHGLDAGECRVVASVPSTLDAATRSLAYLALVAVGLLLTVPQTSRHLLGGVMTGATLVCLYSLATRLLPDRVGTFDSHRRRISPFDADHVPERARRVRRHGAAPCTHVRGSCTTDRLTSDVCWDAAAARGDGLFHVQPRRLACARSRTDRHGRNRPSAAAANGNRCAADRSGGSRRVALVPARRPALSSSGITAASAAGHHVIVQLLVVALASAAGGASAHVVERRSWFRTSPAEAGRHHSCSPSLGGSRSLGWRMALPCTRHGWSGRTSNVLQSPTLQMPVLAFSISPPTVGSTSDASPGAASAQRR